MIVTKVVTNGCSNNTPHKIISLNHLKWWCIYHLRPGI